MLTFALALRDKGVPVPAIAAKLTIKTGKNTGQQPSVASVYRALADSAETASAHIHQPTSPSSAALRTCRPEH